MTVRASFGRKDASLLKSAALPSSAGSTQTAGIDLGGALQARDARVLDGALEIVAPALNTTQLPDAATATYQIEHDSASGFGTVATLLDKCIVQTGAGGAGAAAQTLQFVLPPHTKRYVRVKCTTANTPGDCSGASMTAQFVK